MIKLSNILFAHDTINNNTPAIFKDYFTFNGVSHQHDTINRLNSTFTVFVMALYKSQITEQIQASHQSNIFVQVYGINV